MTIRDHCIDCVESKQGQGFFCVQSYLHLVPIGSKLVSECVRTAGVIVDEKDRRHKPRFIFARCGENMR